MSILSLQFVADWKARSMARAPMQVVPELGFPEILGRARPMAVATRHGNVGCTLYLPLQAAEKPPLYVNMHGGGYVMRGAEQDDPLCRYLAANAGVAVLNVDYDVAPDHRFPVPVEQVFDVVRWAADQSQDWDGKRLAVGGQSAGGALAAAAARLSFEQGSPTIALQVLHYPPLDLVTSAKSKRAAAGKSLIAPWMGEVFDTAYVPDRATRKDRLVSPAWGPNATGLAGIAPALIITCENDRLHDEGVAFAQALGKQGALAEHYDIPNADHAYNLMGGTREQTETVYALIARHLTDCFDEARPGTAKLNE
jgi:acetyl esterase